MEFIANLDSWVHLNISNIYTPLLTKIMIAFTLMGNFLPTFVVAVIIALYFRYKKSPNNMKFFIYSVMGSTTFMLTIKSIIQRPRPSHYLIEATGYSFPSGHATISTALGFSLYLILSKRVKYKKSLLFLSIAYPLIVSFSRIYLQVHYVSDVIGGICLSFFWIVFVKYFSNNKR